MKRLAFCEDHEVIAAIPAAMDVVSSGGVLMVPSESFYGLGADPSSQDGITKICAIKERPAALGMPVLCADWQQLEGLVEVPDRFRASLSQTWPTALTVVLRAKEEFPASRSETLAVRIPDHPALRALLYRIGPITGTSANLHGSKGCTTVDEALRSLAGAPDLVLDAGQTAGGTASTLVDLSGDEARILRPGALQWEVPFPQF